MHPRDSRQWPALRVFLVAIAVVVVLAVSACTTPHRADHRLPVPKTQRFPSPTDVLDGVSAVWRTSAWAVGYYVAAGVTQLTLIERWDGRSWRQVPSPSPGGPGGFSQLNAVSAISAKDAWAVGIDGHARGGQQCLTERWNGTRWMTVPDASAGNLAKCQLSGVVAISASDAWAVGSYFQPVPGHKEGALVSLIEHWDGTSWRQVASPSPGGHSAGNTTGLTEVTATSPRDAWAVGSAAAGTWANAQPTLVEHWNGSKWATVPGPHPGLPDTGSVLNGVAATSTSAWAVGNAAAPFALGLASGRWHQVAIPGKPKMVTWLNAVAIDSAASAWAVGFYYASKYSVSPQRPWIVHWDGSRWRAVRAPYPAGFRNASLVALTAPSPTATWAVGNIDHNTYNPRTLIEHWTGAKWVIVPSPNPS